MAPRIEIPGILEATVELTVRVLDIGLGGFSIETPFELPQGATYKVHLTNREGSSVIVEGRVVHSKLLPVKDCDPRYQVGLQFSGDPARRDSAVAFFLDKVIRSATLDQS